MSKLKLLCTLPNGCGLFIEENGVGGHRYYTDECGIATIVWDTSIVDEATLLTAIVEEHRRIIKGNHESNKERLRDKQL